MKPTRPKYSIKSCPSDNHEELESLLNSMSKTGWDLYTLHETDGKHGLCYNCIFVKESSEDDENNDSYDDIVGFKSKMERMLSQESTPYQKCQELQKKLKEERHKIDKIKAQLEEANVLDHTKLNTQLSKAMTNISQLKQQLKEVISPDYLENELGEEKLSISLSEEIIQLVDPDCDAKLLSETVKIRQKMVEDLGFILPKVDFSDDETLQANEFSINIRGISVFKAFVYLDYLMFRRKDFKSQHYPKDSIKDIDYITGEKIVWIKASETQDYWVKGLTAQEYIAKTLEYICIKNIDDVFDYGDLNRYIELVGDKNVYLVENIVPDYMSLSDLKYLLTNLIKERVSIKDIVYIFEKINDFSEDSERDELLDKVRLSLAKQISAKLADANSTISVIQLSGKTINKIINFTNKNDQDSAIIRVDGVKLNTFVSNLQKLIFSLDISYDKVILLAPYNIRHTLAMILMQMLPNVIVIAEEEVSQDTIISVLEVF